MTGQLKPEWSGQYGSNFQLLQKHLITNKTIVYSINNIKSIIFIIDMRIRQYILTKF